MRNLFGPENWVLLFVFPLLLSAQNLCAQVERIYYPLEKDSAGITIKRMEVRDSKGVFLYGRVTKTIPIDNRKGGFRKEVTTTGKDGSEVVSVQVKAWDSSTGSFVNREYYKDGKTREDREEQYKDVRDERNPEDLRKSLALAENESKFGLNPLVVYGFAGGASSAEFNLNIGRGFTFSGFVDIGPSLDKNGLSNDIWMFRAELAYQYNFAEDRKWGLRNSSDHILMLKMLAGFSFGPTRRGATFLAGFVVGMPVASSGICEPTDDQHVSSVGQIGYGLISQLEVTFLRLGKTSRGKIQNNSLVFLSGLRFEVGLISGEWDGFHLRGQTRPDANEREFGVIGSVVVTAKIDGGRTEKGIE